MSNKLDFLRTRAWMCWVLAGFTLVVAAGLQYGLVAIFAAIGVWFFFSMTALACSASEEFYQEKERWADAQRLLEEIEKQLAEKEASFQDAKK